MERYWVLVFLNIITCISEVFRKQDQRGEERSCPSQLWITLRPWELKKTWWKIKCWKKRRAGFWNCFFRDLEEIQIPIRLNETVGMRCSKKRELTSFWWKWSSRGLLDSHIVGGIFAMDGRFGWWSPNSAVLFLTRTKVRVLPSVLMSIFSESHFLLELPLLTSSLITLTQGHAQVL